MGVSRIDNPNFFLGRDKNGDPAWLRRRDSSVHSGPGCTVGNLLAVADGGSPDGLPVPSPELVRRLRSDKDWSGLDLSGLDLSGLDLWGGWLVLNNTNFAGSDLRGVSLRAAKGSGVNFSGAQTAGMTFDLDALLTDVVAGGSFDMRDVVMGVTTLTFREPTRLLNLGSVVPSPLGGFGVASKIDNADFSGQVIRTDDLAAFSSVTRCNFAGATFEGWKGTRYSLASKWFTSCDFSGVTMKDLDAQSNVFDRCNFVGADLSGWVASNSNRFTGCDFRDADMSRWSKSGSGRFVECFFQGSKMYDVDLTGADGGVLRDIRKSGSKYRSFTLPEAAAKAGMNTDEFAVLVWLGEVESRNNETLDVADTSFGDGIHVPWWAIKNMVSG